jgi:hypothetical protein
MERLEAIYHGAGEYGCRRRLRCEPSAVIAQDFTTDHALAAKALRIPRGQFGIGSSPYLAVIDWLKRWPDTGSRRSLLLISRASIRFAAPGDHFIGCGHGSLERSERT